MADPKTTGQLRRAAIISDAEIDAAMTAFLVDPKVEPYTFKSGHVLDVAAAIEAHRPSKAALADPKVPEGLRKTMARTALILATPREP